MDAKSLSSLLKTAENRFCRFPIVLSGEESWCLSTLQSSLIEYNLEEVLFVGKQDTLQGVKSLPASKVKGLLGGECRILIWDGFSGFHPDALGAASGLVKGGGLLIFLTPSLDKLAMSPDPDYSRMCADQDELSRVNTHFLKRLVQFFHLAPCILFKQTLKTNFRIPDSSPLIAKQTLPTQGQIHAIAAILHVVEGHRRRPLVITADRGRGKSSSLGIAAAQLILKYQKTILITAPSKHACAKAFQHFSETISNEGFDTDSYQPYFQFISPDELLKARPNCQLLMIDEAAGIPAPILTKLLSQYSRLVFSTTIHGYEGNGQGFAIRFRKQLDIQTPNWKSYHLSQAVRWCDNDPLEQWISQLLFLSLDSQSFLPSSSTSRKADTLSFVWPSQEELSNKPGLLGQIIGLLVNAHYQTSPDDIRLVLDHSGVQVVCAFSEANMSEKENELVAAMLLIAEGHIDNPELTNNILKGHRRLRGHLVPQSLATSSGNQVHLAERSLRIMRIAVKAEYENQGIGSQLISQACQYAEENNVDYLGTAFGLTPELLSFWRKNLFSLVKLGIQRDNASGCYAAIMQRPISASADEQREELEMLFSRQLLNGISRQYREHSASILRDAIGTIKLPYTEKKLESREYSQLERFAQANLAMEDCMNELVKFLFISFAHGTRTALDIDTQTLLIRRILQAQPISTCVEEFTLSGKKELEKTLRNAIGTLLSELEK
jgi:tRNA(Met) cytidine acetyltransferase